jgi:hypothetical protein
LLATQTLLVHCRPLLQLELGKQAQLTLPAGQVEPELLSSPQAVATKATVAAAKKIL